MKQELETQDRLIRYLLGDLNEEEMLLLEEEFFADDEIFAELKAGEREIIDRYVEGELSHEDRNLFEKNYLINEERKEKLRFARALKEYQPPPEQNRSAIFAFLNPKSMIRFFATYKGLATAVIIVIAVGVGAWRIFLYQSSEQKVLIALSKAYPHERSLDTRISGLAYAPRNITRGNAAIQVDSQKLDLAMSLAAVAVDENSSASSHRSLGRVYLAKRDFDKAIEQFKKSLALDANDAQAENDLGAALLERAQIVEDPGRKPVELAESLVHLNKALEIDSSLLEALFNRALCHTDMFLLNEAQEDWRNYLKKDSSSPWAKDARDNLEKIEEMRKRSSLSREQLFQAFLESVKANDGHGAWDLVRRSYSTEGNIITNTVLDRYLDLRVKNNLPEAEIELALLRHIGDLELENAHDRFTLELAQFYENAATSKAENLKPLIHARALLKTAFEDFSQSRASALETYRNAESLFLTADDFPESIFVKYRIAHCYLIKLNFADGLPTIENLRSDCTGQKYKWLLSQALLLSATVKVGQSKFSDAIDFSNASLTLVREIGDYDGTLRLYIQLADENRNLKDTATSFDFLWKGLQLSIDTPTEPMQIWGLSSGMSLVLGSLGLNAAALDYQKQAVQIAVGMNRPLITARTYEYLGSILERLNRNAEAAASIKLAYDVGDKMPQGVDADSIKAHSSLQLATFYSHTGSYDEAVKSYDTTIGLYDKLKYGAKMYDAHKGKLLLYLSQKDDRAAESEIEFLMPALESYRNNILRDSERKTFFDTEQNICDLAIGFAHINQKDDVRAFNYSERCRGRSLFDQLKTNAPGDQNIQGSIKTHLLSGEPFTYSEVKSELPNDLLIIQYAILEDRLLIWLVSNEKLETAEFPIKSYELKQKITNFVEAISRLPKNNDREVNQMSRELYGILVGPIEKAISSSRQLCVVPDKYLHGLPFTALKTSSGKYLIEDFDLMVSDSSTLFVIETNEAGAKSAVSSERSLIVGDPEFDRSVFPSLPRMKSAREEAERVGSIYPGSTVLTGGNAKAGRVADEILRSDIVHLAIHYVIDEKNSSNSKLIFASDRPLNRNEIGSDGSISASQISEMKLTRPRLVVLSACQTGIEQFYGGEGPVSIAREFLGAGVPVVVASLWPVNSDATERLMVTFHSHRKNDYITTIRALNSAQRDMLVDSNVEYRKPYYWASFVSVGGQTTY